MTGCLLRFAFVALLVIASGCTRTRVVTVQGDAPPPSVVTQSDTLYLASPPDTLYLDRVSIEYLETPAGRDSVRKPVEPTLPERVIEYVTARGDSSDAFRLLALSVDSSEVWIAGVQGDWHFRAPEAGESLLIEASGDDLTASVVGMPSRPPPVSVEVPGCPACLYPDTFWGRTRFGLGLLLTLVVGIGVGLAVPAVRRLLPIP